MPLCYVGSILDERFIGSSILLFVPDLEFSSTLYPRCVRHSVYAPRPRRAFENTPNGGCGWFGALLAFLHPAKCQDRRSAEYEKKNQD
jgi:hypothetical protein